MLCFLDYDGTLADDFDKINPDNINFINQNRQSFVLASGRSLKQIQAIYAKHNFTIDAIGGNGCFLLEHNSLRKLYELDINMVNVIVNKLMTYDVPIIIHTIKANYNLIYNKTSLSKNNIRKIANEYSQQILNKTYADDAIYKLYTDTFFSKNIKNISLSNMNKLKEITGIEVFFYNALVRDAIRNIFLEFGQYTESYYTSIEFNGEASKGKAVEAYLSKHKNEFTISIGNGINDISMLKVTNLAFKMKNSDDDMPGIELPYGPDDPYLKNIFNI